MTWTVLGESVIGTGHRTRSVPCQDAFRFRLLGPAGEWLVVAVADGAGSASHADIGATVACDEFVRLVEQRDFDSLLTRNGVIQLFADVRGSIIAAAETQGVRPREMACTALLALVGPESAAFAQLGDGAIVAGSESDYRTVFWPEPAEYANVTDFLTDELFAETVRFEVSNGRHSDVAVFTDGLQRLALDYAAVGPHQEFFRPLFHRLRSEPDPETLFEPFRAFLDSPRVNERTDDDKTLVLAARCSAHVSTPCSG